MNRFQSLVHGEGEGGLDGGTTFIDHGGGKGDITGEFSGIGIEENALIKPAFMKPVHC